MQLLFYLVYYHSTCFGRGLRPSSGVIHKTVMAATSVCQYVWSEVVLSLVVCVRWIWMQCGLGVHEDSVAWWSSFLHHISAYLRVTMWHARTQHYPHGHSNHTAPRFNVHIPLETGLLHPTRIDTHWWLPVQFCVLLLKMDANRVRNMYSDNKPSKTKAASRWLLTNTRSFKSRVLLA